MVEARPLAHLPGPDIMAQARGGLMSITGNPHGSPAKLGDPVCNPVCGIYTALEVRAVLLERAVVGAVRQVGSSMRFSRSKPRREGAGPVLGADTREVLSEIDYAHGEVDRMVQSGAVVQTG